MLKEPTKFQRPVPLLHDLTFEAVHALEVETQTRKRLNETPDESETEIRKKVFGFFRQIESHVERLCSIYNEACNYGITLQESHPVILIFFNYYFWSFYSIFCF